MRYSNNGSLTFATLVIPTTTTTTHIPATLPPSDPLPPTTPSSRCYPLIRYNPLLNPLLVHFEAASFTAALEGRLRVQGGTMVVSSHHPGCIENRWKFMDGCEYDGKVTSTLFRGKTLLYVR